MLEWLINMLNYLYNGRYCIDVNYSPSWHEVYKKHIVFRISTSFLVTTKNEKIFWNTKNTDQFFKRKNNFWQGLSQLQLLTVLLWKKLTLRHQNTHFFRLLMSKIDHQSHNVLRHVLIVVWNTMITANVELFNIINSLITTIYNKIACDKSENELFLRLNLE